MNVLDLSPGFPPNLRFFCEHLAARGGRVLDIGDRPPGRRDGRAYLRDEATLHRLLRPMIVLHRRLPRELALMQGDAMFLRRSPDLDEVRRGIALVQARVG